MVLDSNREKTPTAFHNIMNKKESLINQEEIRKKAQEHFIEEADMRTIWLTIHQCRNEINECMIGIWDKETRETAIGSYRLIKRARKNIKKYLSVCISNFKEIRAVDYSRLDESLYDEIIKKTVEGDFNERKIESLWADRQILEYIYTKEFKYQRYLTDGL